MAVKTFRPTTPARRKMSVEDFTELSKKSPEKSLLRPLHSKAGRNNQGRITTRHRGGGHKRRYRIIDFRRRKDGVPGRVAALEYDPNRSAHIALIHYADGEKRYILAPKGLEVGDEIMSGPDAPLRVGNARRLRDLPTGMVVHNVELKPGRGGQLARSAGASAQVAAKEGDYAHIRLPSGEVRLVRLECRATIGQVGNVEHENIELGKAGRNRWRGVRPTVRGTAMNPVDHPHGGGEGRSPIGRHPVSPWGKRVQKKTRKRNKDSDKYIVRRRSEKKRG